MNYLNITGLAAFVGAGFLLAGCGTTQNVGSASSDIEIVLASDVEWTHLNPKRGDLAPKAGTLWGDRKGTEPTGFLLKPTDGFESPPHIHNVSYRGVVIRGVLHNDDPDAANMWMPAGSFWTQPKGEVHITAAKGSDSLAYIEIEEGPYLVLPSEEAFDSGERPVNVDERNLVWLDASDIRWVDHSISTTPGGPQVAVLWGSTSEGELNGSFIKLPAGFRGAINSQGSTFKAVLIQGELTHAAANGTMEVGSYFSSAAATHAVSSEETVVLYVRTDGRYAIKPN
ncbi:DUF4437 domain-containing protein [Coraliomargarita akajimensis]|nr:DUF4437 domain-containing protein [Coraliomargarita akajimensis]